MQQGKVLLDADSNEARVPGTVAEALINAGRWSWDDPVPLDEREVCYRCDFQAAGAHCIEFHGLATIADIYLDGKQIATSRSSSCR